MMLHTHSSHTLHTHFIHSRHTHSQQPECILVSLCAVVSRNPLLFGFSWLVSFTLPKIFICLFVYLHEQHNLFVLLQIMWNLCTPGLYQFEGWDYQGSCSLAPLNPPSPIQYIYCNHPQVFKRFPHSFVIVDKSYEKSKTNCALVRFSTQNTRLWAHWFPLKV